MWKWPKGLGRKIAGSVLLVSSAALATDAITDSVHSETGWRSTQTAAPATPADTAVKAAGAAAVGVAGAGMLALSGLGSARLGQHSFEVQREIVLRPYVSRLTEPEFAAMLDGLRGHPGRMHEWLQLQWRDHPFLRVDVRHCELTLSPLKASYGDDRRLRAAATIGARIEVTGVAAEDDAGARWAAWIRDQVLDQVQSLLEDKIQHVIWIKMERGLGWGDAGWAALDEQIRDSRRRLART